MPIDMNDRSFRVHQQIMSDGRSLFFPEMSYRAGDGCRIWVRLCAGECVNMEQALEQVRVAKVKFIPVEDIFHPVE